MEENLFLKQSHNIRNATKLDTMGFTTIDQPSGCILAMTVGFGTALFRVNEKLYNHMAWMIIDSDSR